MIITITGDIGSGKSTIAKKLAKELGYDHYYMGKLRREAAKQRGMTLAEYNKFGESNPETDHEVDEYQKKLGKEKDNFVIEGRTSWFLIPQSIKLYLKVKPEEGAKRVFLELQNNDQRNEDQELKSIDEVLKSHQKRLASDKARYLKFYGKDCFNEENFDFVIDTTKLNIEGVFNNIWNFIKSQQ